MPTTRREYENRPYVRPAYEPDTRTLLQLMQMAGRARAEAAGQQGQSRAQGLMTLGQILSQGLGSLRQEGERKQAAAFERDKEATANRIRMNEIGLREMGLVADQQQRETAAREKAVADSYKRGGEVAEEIGYGPMAESQVDPVMQGPAAGRVRYSFGPGTAEGPELQPTRQQQRGIETEKAIQAMGGQIGPNGQVVMPPKTEQPPNPTEASLAMMAARGDQAAERALDRLRSLRASQSVGGEPLEPVIDPRTGEAVLMPRSQARGMRPATTREQPTEDERKTAGFYKQMVDAIAVIDETEGQLTAKDIYQMNTLPQEALSGMANRGEMSEAAKRYLRAFEQFTEANLRPKSGAAIGPTEYARDLRTYGKQYSETPKLNEDRKRARSVALETLKVRAGRANPKESAGGGKVKMQAPDGSTKEVDRSEVEHYKSLGAKVVGG